MKQPTTQPYSRYSADALKLLSSLNKIGRKQRKLAAQEIAGRAGISRGLVQRIEKGEMMARCGLSRHFRLNLMDRIGKVHPSAGFLTK